MAKTKADFLVIGSGIAGLFFALKACRLGSVVILAKGSAEQTGTSMAQGGIASVTDQSLDSFEDHIRDTIQAGAGLCHEDIVRLAVNQAPSRIEDLIQFGVNFNRLPNRNSFDLTKEGGHSHRRILHSFDQTGKAIQSALLNACSKTENIQILEFRMAIDLVVNKNADSLLNGPEQCLGAYILNEKTGQVDTFESRFTVLATGGAGKVYLYTSNGDVATGDGIAMAKRAGAQISNMEFLQFHPTCLYHPQARNFLITEAMRGEGAELILPNGDKFMKRHHPQGSLAPRDIVARAIDFEMKRNGLDHVFLDPSNIHPDEIRKRFPGIYENCMKLGLDITQKPIPVVPAAHYLCGGVLTDQNGLTTIQRLLAIGEVACTGLHGANRLASNSLMEATVFAHNAFEFLKKHFREFPDPQLKIKDWDIGDAVPPDEMIIVKHNWDEIRQLMWNYVGIVRSTKRLQRANHRIKVLQEEIKEYYWSYTVSKDLLELRNIADVAEMIITSALRRKESRGIHYMIDFPHTNDAFKTDTLL